MTITRRQLVQAFGASAALGAPAQLPGPAPGAPTTTSARSGRGRRVSSGVVMTQSLVTW